MRWHGLAVVALLAGGAREAAAQSRITLHDDTARAEFLITVGPVDLPLSRGTAHEGHDVSGHHAHGGGGGGTDAHAAHAPVFPPIDEVLIPRDGYLHGFSYRVLDGEGRELPTAVLHHLNLILPDSRELFLPISLRLLAMGRETGAQSMDPLEIGVPVRGGQRVTVAAMLHNPTGQAHTGVSVEVRLEYVRADQRPRLLAYPFQMDIGFPAGDKDVDLPPGRSVFAWEGSPAIAGRIMAIGGHLHDYAVQIELVDVTTGQRLWQGLPTHDRTGTLTGVTVEGFDEEDAIVLDPAHTYRVVATYRNPTQQTLYAGGMGVVGGVFLPDDAARWPAADSSDRLYRLDRMHYLRQLRGRYDQITAVANAEPARGRAP
jgi:hypothetical protein